MAAGHIIKSSPSNRQSVERGESAHSAVAALAAAPPRLPRGGSTLRSTDNIDINQSLDALCLAGFDSEEGTETTSAFHSIGTDKIHAAVDYFLGHEMYGEAGFDICMIIDSKQV